MLGEERMGKNGFLSAWGFIVIVIGLLGVATPQTVGAQGLLENPNDSSCVSGISVVSGWKCTAGTITVQFDTGPTYTAAYGTIREDTQGVCGDTNNGFGLLFNFNRLGDGTHSVRVFDNGAQFGSATFTVQTL